MRIAIAGPMGSGKTTISEYMNRVYGTDTLSFGFYVREALELIGVNENVWDKRKSPELRQLLQTLGQGMRDYDEDFWVNKMRHELDSGFFDDDVVVDDLRYYNEAAMLQDEGFYLIKLECPSLLEDGDPAREHESEHGLDGWDDWNAVITSHPGDIEGLFARIDELVQKWESE